MPDEQLGFFGEATPLDQLGPREVRVGQRGGSAEAATIPDNPKHYATILQYATWMGQFSDEQLAIRMVGQHPGTVSKRRLRLERAGLIEVIPAKGRTSRGVECLLFRITDKGREVLAEWQKAQ